MKKLIGTHMLVMIVLVMFNMTPAPSARSEFFSSRVKLYPIPNFSPMRGGASLGGTTSTTAGTEVVFDVNNGTDEGVTYYRFSVGIFDNTHTDGAADTMYDEMDIEPKTEGTLAYTFFIPGTYGIWCYRYDADMNIIPFSFRGAYYDYIYKEVEVSKDKETALDWKVDQIAEACAAEDDYETVYNINKWLCDNVVYDYDQQYFSPDAALLGGASVCNGYCRAFKLIADACGLESRRAIGGGHAWNAVVMDGEWYYVDPTWNDTTGENRYLGVNNEILNYDHTVEHVIGGAVECTELANNFYVRSGLWQTLAQDVMPVIQGMVGRRLHIFQKISMGETYVSDGRLTSSSAQKNCNGIITAYMLTKQDWAYENENFSGNFRYNYTSNSISGELAASGILILPDDLEILEDEALVGVDAYYVIIPDQCSRIGASVFANSKVWEVKMPGTDVDIDEDAFADTVGLTIRTSSGSPAAGYANEHHIPLVEE